MIRRLHPAIRTLVVATALAAGALVPGTAAAEFDGRLPIARSKLIYRFGEQSGVPEWAQGFWEAEGDRWALYWDPLLETPRYLSPRAKLFIGEPADEAAVVSGTWSFIAQRSEFFGVEPHDLLGPWVHRVNKSWLVIYRQAAAGIPIRGASLRIVVREDGTVGAVKAFLLRNPPREPRQFAYQDVVERTLAEHGAKVRFAERQLYFLRYDPASIAPVWYARGEDANREPREYFLDPESGRLWEERRIVSEFGPIAGGVHGIYPDPNDLFATPNRLTLNTHNGEPQAFPIAGARLSERLVPTIGWAMSDEDGQFTIQIAGGPDDTADLDCVVEYGRCGQQVTQPLSQTEMCLPDDFKLYLQVYRTNFNCVVEEGFASRMQSSASAVKLNSSVNFLFNSFFDRSEAGSLQLMAFHHIREFIEESQKRIQDNLLAHKDFFPLTVVVPGNTGAPEELSHRREYFANQNNSKICISAIVDGRDPADVDGRDPKTSQWMTPTFINHEYAHHLVYILTGAYGSRHFDCQRVPYGCMSTEADKVSEDDILEGVVDALAAYKAGMPTFGFYETGIPGEIGYDISASVSGLPEERAVMGGTLWKLRERFVRTVPGKVSDLVYRWVARHNTATGTERLFDGSASIMDELLDILDEPGFTDESDGDRSTISNLEREVIEAFAGTKHFHVPFIRGDANQDRVVNITDAVFLLAYLFFGQVMDQCQDAMDLNGDEKVNITDPVYLLSFLFLGGQSPEKPFPRCGLDPTSAENRLSCREFACPF